MPLDKIGRVVDVWQEWSTMMDSESGNFFEVWNIKRLGKLWITLIGMEGNTDHWFRFWRQNSKNPSWEDLATTLLWRFGASGQSIFSKTLAAIRWIGSVEDFIQELKSWYLNEIEHWKIKWLGIFLQGYIRIYKIRFIHMTQKTWFEPWKLYKTWRRLWRIHNTSVDLRIVNII